jgi:hypothetical protein
VRESIGHNVAGHGAKSTDRTEVTSFPTRSVRLDPSSKEDDCEDDEDQDQYPAYSIAHVNFSLI